MAPLINRGVAILARRGEIANLPIDGRTTALQYRSPHARYQAQQDAQNALLWLSVVRDLGPEAAGVVDPAATARWLARAFGVPGELMVPEPRATSDVWPPVEPEAALMMASELPALVDG